MANRLTGTRLGRRHFLKGAALGGVAAVAAPVEAAEERQAATPERSRRVLMGAVIGALVVIALVLLASNAARDRHSDAPANDTPALQQPAPPLAQAEPPAVSPPAPASRADVTAPPPATAATGPTRKAWSGLR